MNRHPKLRRLRPEALHFFDTNFFLHDKSDLPALKSVPLRSRWITETVQQEVREKLGDSAERAMDGYRPLAFRDLYEDNHRVCPVFYWYVLSMYNPATVGSSSFFEDLYEAQLLKNTVTQGDRDAFEKFRRAMSAWETQKEKSRPVFDRLRRMASGLHKKARRSLQDKHPAYIRDIKSLSLALYHSLSSRHNVVYYTTDADPPILLLKWLDAMTAHIALAHDVMRRLGEIDRQHVMNGGTVSVVLDYAAFSHEKSALLKSMLNDRKKRDACRFTIKYWNPTDRRLDESVYLVFEDEVAGWLSNLHGSASCGGTPNGDGWNWARFRYFWPPEAAYAGKLRVEVHRKLFASRTAPIEVTTDEHDRRCSYRRDDFDGRIQSWSQFT